MIANRSAPKATVVPILVYEDVAAALNFLTRAFGFKERLRAEHGGSITHAQMDVGECAIMNEYCANKGSGPFVWRFPAGTH